MLEEGQFWLNSIILGLIGAQEENGLPLDQLIDQFENLAPQKETFLGYLHKLGFVDEQLMFTAAAYEIDPFLNSLKLFPVNNYMPRNSQTSLPIQQNHQHRLVLQRVRGLQA